MTTVQRIWRFKRRLIKLTASKCLKCGYIAYPPKHACPRCGSRDLVSLDLPSKGRIETYTILNVPIKGFENSLPLIIALIRLGDALVMSEVINVKPEEVREGMEVEATIAPSARTLDGAIPYVVKFKPVEGSRKP